MNAIKEFYIYLLCNNTLVLETGTVAMTSKNKKASDVNNNKNRRAMKGNMMSHQFYYCSS